MLLLGYTDVVSLSTGIRGSGIRGWKDYDQPLVDKEDHDVDPDEADAYFTPRLRPDQLRP